MKYEFKITDEAGNVQLYNVSLSLPSDEDIKNFASKKFPYRHDNDIGTTDKRQIFIDGAKFVIDKIRQ